MGTNSGEINGEALNDVSSSGPRGSTGNVSGLSGGPCLQRNASLDADSHMLMARSPMNGSAIMPHSSNQDLGSQAQQCQANQATSSSATLPISRVGQVQMPTGPQGPSPFIQDPLSMSPLQKRPRYDIKPEGILQQQALQPPSQRHDLMHMQNRTPQMWALMQQQRLKHHQEHQLRQQCVQPGVLPPAIKRQYDGAACSRRLMQYLYHLRQRPADNNITYWRKFVIEYYSPCAKKKWCLSSYENAAGVSHQSLDAWQCEICGSRSGKGFAANAGILARLYLLKFQGGAIDEIMFLGLPCEYALPSGLMVLEYPKAVLENVLDQVRVVHEGHLRIVFAHDLKILSWEFCVWRHEEYFTRRLLAPQVNRFVQVTQSLQGKISESGRDSISQSDLEAHNAMIMIAGRQLVRSLEPQCTNELGFPKRFGRVIQILEVVNCMRPLMNFCSEHKYGPIDGLKIFPRLSSPSAQMQRTDQVTSTQGLATDQITASRPMASNHVVNDAPDNNQQHVVGRGALAGPAQAAPALTNYQSQQTRQNSMNLTQNGSLQQEASPALSHSPATSGMPSISPGAVQNLPASGFPSAQTMQHPSTGGNGILQQNQSTSEQGSQTSQQQRIHHMSQQNLTGGSSILQQNQSTSVQGSQTLQQRRLQQMPQQDGSIPGGRTMQHQLPSGNGILQQNQSGSGQQSQALQQQLIHQMLPQDVGSPSCHRPSGNGILQQQTVHQMPYQRSSFPSVLTMQHPLRVGNGILQQNQSMSAQGNQALQQQRIHQMPQQDSGFPSTSQTVMQHRSPGMNGILQQNQSVTAQGSQASQQLPRQDMNNNGESTTQHTIHQQNQRTNSLQDGPDRPSNSPENTSAGNDASGNLVTQPASNVEPPPAAAAGNNRLRDNQLGSGMDFQLSNDFMTEVTDEFVTNGLFGELDDSMSFWDDG